MEKLEGQQCSFCGKKTLTLMEDSQDIPFFGKTFLFSMQCSTCKFFKSDVEAAEQKEPCKITFMIEKEKDMQVRVVKSSEGCVSFPSLRLKVESGPSSEGYVSNIEGVLDRFVKIIEAQKESTDDDGERKSAKNLLKKIRKIKYGDVATKVVIEDMSGNSAIISEKATIEKMKGKKK